MNKQKQIIITEDIVVNKSYFQPMASEITCSICKGLLIFPVLCSSCDTPFCSSCIFSLPTKGTENEFIGDKCINCNSNFVSKEINKMTKNIMEKVMLRCTYCNSCNISLPGYLEHYMSCETNFNNIEKINQLTLENEILKNNLLEFNESNLTKLKEIHTENLILKDRIEKLEKSSKKEVLLF